MQRDNDDTIKQGFSSQATKNTNPKFNQVAEKKSNQYRIRQSDLRDPSSIFESQQLTNDSQDQQIQLFKEGLEVPKFFQRENNNSNLFFSNEDARKQAPIYLMFSGNYQISSSSR